MSARGPQFGQALGIHRIGNSGAMSSFSHAAFNSTTAYRFLAASSTAPRGLWISWNNATNASGVSLRLTVEPVHASGTDAGKPTGTPYHASAVRDFAAPTSTPTDGWQYVEFQDTPGPLTPGEAYCFVLQTMSVSGSPTLTLHTHFSATEGADAVSATLRAADGTNRSSLSPQPASGPIGTVVWADGVERNPAGWHHWKIVGNAGLSTTGGIGVEFSYAAPIVVREIWLDAFGLVNGGPMRARIWSDASGQVVAESMTLPGWASAQVTANQRVRFPLPVPATLLPGTYRAIIDNVGGATVANVSIARCRPGVAAFPNWAYCRTSNVTIASPTWETLPGTVFFMGLMLDELPAGGGGPRFVPNFQGGFLG